MSKEKANAVVLGYILGYNVASAASSDLIKDAYRQGVIDGKGGDAVEPYDTTEPPTFTIDEDGNCIDPAVTDMFNGVFVCRGNETTGEADSYYRVYLTPYHYEEGDTVRIDRITVDKTYLNGPTYTEYNNTHNRYSIYAGAEMRLKKFELYQSFFYAVYDQRDLNTGVVQEQRVMFNVFNKVTDFLKYTNVKPF